MIEKHVSLALVALTLACAATSPTGPEGAFQTQDLDGQIATGRAKYDRECKSCHGPAGQNGDAPALSGPGSLPAKPPKASGMRIASFETARDVADFASTSMPPGRSRTLTLEEHYAIIAYLLDERGAVQDEPLTPQRAAQIPLR